MPANRPNAAVVLGAAIEPEISHKETLAGRPHGQRRLLGVRREKGLYLPF